VLVALTDTYRSVLSFISVITVACHSSELRYVVVVSGSLTGSHFIALVVRPRAHFRVQGLVAPV